ncbi:MAG: glycosyltransferase family 39 protein [Thermoanaerobaculia bacterium]
MLQRLLSGSRPERARVAIETLAFALLAFWVAGFYWAPSDVEGRARAQSALFYLAVAPLLGLAALPALRRLRPARIAPVAVAFAALLALGVAFPRGAQELSAAQALRHAAAAALFVPGVALLLNPGRRERLERILLLAASTAALVSLLFLAGGRSLAGRALAPAHDDHPNRWAAALGVAAVVALARLVGRKERGATLVALSLLLPTILLTRSRGELAATIAGAAVLLAARRDGRTARAAVAVLFAAVSCVGLAMPDALERPFARGDAGRTFIWSELLHRTAGHRLFGLGLTASDDVVFPPGSADFPGGWIAVTAHGMFVGTFLFGGASALALLLVLVALAFRQALRVASRGDALLLALLVHAVVWALFDGHGGVAAPSDVSWVVFWLPVGLAAAAELSGPAPLAANPASEPAAGEAPRGRDATPGLALLGVSALLVAARLPALGPSVTEPWAFRQLDTAFTIRTFADTGLDLLRPAVAWLGGRGGTFFAFPLAEAFASLGRTLAGGSLVGGRVALLALFAAAALPVARLSRRLSGRGAAPFAAVALLALPIGLVGSTALLPDVPALLLAPAAACLVLRGLARRSVATLAAAAAVAGLALVVKPSLLVPWLPLLLAAALGGRRRRAALRALPLLIVPVAALVLWELHVARANVPWPDVSFLAGIRVAPADPRWPALAAGALLSSTRVGLLADALLGAAAGPALLVAAFAGTLLATRPRRRRALLPAAGALLHLLLFSGECLTRDAELLVVAPALALAVAEACAWIAATPVRRSLPARVAVSLSLGALLLSGLPATRRTRAVRNPLALAVEAASRTAPPRSVVLLEERGEGGRGPLVLYAAGRGACLLPRQALTPDAVGGLLRAGVRRLALVSRGPAPAFLSPTPMVDAPVDDRGTRVRVWELRPPGASRERS